MDAAKKAFLKSRMKEVAQKREKRIDSPLVRYNDLGQPVCKVCNIAAKSESLWPAHLASRQHKETVEKFKAQAKGITATPNASNHVDSNKTKTRVSSTLPDDFWDQPETKRMVSDTAAKQNNVPSGATEYAIIENSKIETIPAACAQGTTSESVKIVTSLEVQPLKSAAHTSAQVAPDGPVGGKGPLPEGFFDNVDADYRARGLEPPKYDIQDEWKEFQKAIRDDVQEVDLRFEEEEFDAAEDREVLENLQQRELLERIEKLRKNELRMKFEEEEEEIAEVITKVACRKPFKNINLTVDEDSGSDDGSEEEDILMDWRAKQF